MNKLEMICYKNASSYIRDHVRKHYVSVHKTVYLERLSMQSNFVLKKLSSKQHFLENILNTLKLKCYRIAAGDFYM